MNCIAGVFPPDEGQIKINDVDVTKMSEFVRARYIGRVFQDPMKGTAGDMQVEEKSGYGKPPGSASFSSMECRRQQKRKLLLSFLKNWI